MHNDTYKLDLQSRIVWARRTYFVECDSNRKAIALRAWYWLVIENTKRQGGLEDDDDIGCMHPEHQPPTHIHIPQGMRYRHVCPGCGAEIVLRPLNVRFMKTNFTA